MCVCVCVLYMCIDNSLSGTTMEGDIGASWEGPGDAGRGEE